MGLVSTLAGSGVAGFADGNGIVAQFNHPAGLAMSSSGKLYVADSLNHRVRMIDAAGTGSVSTLSGTGVAGFANGQATLAQFNQPMSVAVDLYGGVVVADMLNHRIRRIDVAGNTTTIAGDGIAGFVDGTYTFSQLNSPAGVTVDIYGSIMISDTLNHRLRQLTGIYGLIATITNVNEGAILAGTSQLFSWMDTGSDGYFLTVGTALGQSNLYSSGWLPAGTTSQNVTGIPTNGYAIYVRLHSWINGAWQVSDLRCTASYNTPVSQIIAPINGAVLTSTSQLFSWRDSGVVAYFLQVGSYLGGNDYYSSGPITGGVTTATVSGLPADGSTVYVRLFSFETSTVYHIVDTSFTAYSVPDTIAPVVIAPANISVNAVDANGTAITDAAIAAFLNAASATDLVSGNLVPSNDAPTIFPAGVTTTVSFFATDSSGNIGTATASVTVNSFDTTQPVINPVSQITAPVNGAVLSSTSQLFSWQDTGVWFYYLVVGSYPGLSNYYSSGVIIGGTTTATVNGLPADGSTVYVRLYSFESSSVYHIVDTSYTSY